MIYSLVIQCSPSNTALARSALAFAQAVIARQHALFRLFFYGDGVWLTNQLAVDLQGEARLYQDWQQFIAEHKIDAVSCITASLKRGVLNEQEGQRYEKHTHNLAPEFQLSGLGQWVEASIISDRVITFG